MSFMKNLSYVETLTLSNFLTVDDQANTQTVEITNIKQLDCRLLPETPARCSAIGSVGEIHTNIQPNFVRQKEEEGRGSQLNRYGHFGRVKWRRS